MANAVSKALSRNRIKKNITSIAANKDHQ